MNTPKLSYIYSPEFEDVSRYPEMLADINFEFKFDINSSKRTGRSLTGKQESHLFRRMNLLLHIASKNIDNGLPAHEELDKALDMRNRLIEYNLPLAWSRAKVYYTAFDSFEDAVSEFTLVIGNCVTKFNYSFGWKFGTYAYNAIYRSLGDKHRKHIKNQRCTAQLREDTELLAAPGDFENDIMSADWISVKSSKVNEYLNKMRSNYRRATNYFYINGLSYKEIAAKMHKSLSAIKYMIRYTMLRLREEFSQAKN